MEYNCILKLVELLRGDSSYILTVWLLLERSACPSEWYDYEEAIPEEFRSWVLSLEEVQQIVDKIMSGVASEDLPSDALNCVVGLPPKYTSTSLSSLIGGQQWDADAIRNVVTLIQDSLLWSQSDDEVKSTIERLVEDGSLVGFLKKWDCHEDPEVKERVDICFELLDSGE